MDASFPEPGERRRHPRVALQAAAAISADGGDTAPASVRDISLGGACLVSERPPPVGTEVDIHVTSGKLRGVRLRAQVIQQRADSVGVRFADAPSLIEAMIQETVLAELSELSAFGALGAEFRCA